MIPVRLPTKSTPNKYRARRTKTADGITHASAKQARRWMELKVLEAVGEITHLAREVRIPLYAQGPTLIGHYVADHIYHDRRSGRRIVEDVKSEGTRTALYRWKKKHFEAQSGETITEI